MKLVDKNIKTVIISYILRARGKIEQMLNRDLEDITDDEYQTFL